MYKLILVDDEEEVRRGILEKIDWHKYGFEIAGEAENGMDALDIAERVSPDVVITDIKMPFMDGLALSQRLRERFPTTKIIILTGFEEFEYAQLAIKLDVVEYILKPISSAELGDILIKIKSDMDNEIARKKDMEILKEYYQRSLPILREKFLESLIINRLNINEIAERSNSYGVRLNGDGFVASALRIDFNSLNRNSDLNPENRIGDPDYCKSEDRELVKLAVLHICEEVVGKSEGGIAFLHNENIVIIFISENKGKEASLEKIYLTIEEIMQNVKKYYGLAMIAGIGNYCANICDISYSYENAINALDYRIILRNGNIIYIEDMEPECTSRVVFDELKERSVASCIKVGTVEEIMGTFNNLFKEILDSNASFKDYQIYLMEVLTTILKVARDIDADMDKIFGVNCNLFVDLYKFKDLGEVKEWLTSICIRIKAYVARERQDASKLIVRKAKEYVENYYNESDITIDKICKYLHISPAYFSTIFKRETKLTFVNYLTHVRMEAAKELLRASNFKTLEVARMVGFSEPNYFSYCFKKNFDISPSEYRKAFKTT